MFPGAREARGRRAGRAAAVMETLYRVPFLVLECPNLKLKKPPWVHMPSAMTVYALVVVSYFLITGGNSAVMGRVGAAEARGRRARLRPGGQCRAHVGLQAERSSLHVLPRREVLFFSLPALSLEAPIPRAELNIFVKPRLFFLLLTTSGSWKHHNQFHCVSVVGQEGGGL